MKIPDSINLYVKSMGKNLRVTAIFTDIKKCNDYCNSNNDGVVAVIGNDDFILCADCSDKGEE